MQIFKYFLRYMNTKKALSRWTVFYVGLLIVSVIYNSIYTFQFYDFSDLFINYQGGFIRRGCSEKYSISFISRESILSI